MSEKTKKKTSSSRPKTVKVVTVKPVKKQVSSLPLSDQVARDHQPQKKIHKPKVKPVWWITSLVALLFISAVFSYLFFYLKMELKRYQPYNLDVTFTTPHQVVVFFKTQGKTPMYLKAGTKKNRWESEFYPNTKQASHIHIVEVSPVPAEGLWVKFQAKDTNIFINWFLPIERIVPVKHQLH